MSTHKDISKNTTCPVNPMSWGCKKIQRVVTSTLAAETVSLQYRVGSALMDSPVLGLDVGLPSQMAKT